MRIFIPFLLTLLSFSTHVISQPATPANVLCYQEIIASNSNYATLDASIAAWSAKLQTALGLSGDVHQYVDWAQVADRTGFENGCDGPYTTVADVYVHIQTTSAAYSGLSTQLESFIAANGWTAQPAVACSARSVVTYLPGCGQVGGASPATTAPTDAATTAPTQAATTAPTQAATSAPTEAATTAPTQAATSAPTEAATSAPTEAATSAPTEAATSAPTQAATSAPTEAATSAPTEAATSAPTTAATSAPTEAATSAPTEAATSAPTPTRANAPPDNGPTATPNNILCYQEIVGSNANYAAVDASISTWANNLETALGFTGDVHQYVDWAQVPDRTGFENGCDGPYTTVADVFVHIETTADEYDALSAKMETFITANAWTSQPNIACSARSIVTFIPGCGKLGQTGGSPVTTTPPTSAPTTAGTSAPTTAGTDAPTTAATDAPTTAATSAPTTAGTSAPTTAGTDAPTTAPTTAATDAPTTAPTTAPTSGPTEVPSPANVVCYQSIFGSNSDYGNASASIEAWANKLQVALGLTGDVHTIVDWSQVPDRTNFEDCVGPYQTVADVFVHIPSDAAGYDALSIKLEAFVLANPLTAQPHIVCAARSVTTFLPTCGKVPTAPNQPGGGSATVCYQSIVGSSNGTYAQVESELSAWATKLATTLSLSGDIHQYIDWAQVPDRTNFENGCDGPYTTVADIFVHIATTSANYDTMVANVNSFQATNSLVSVSTGGVVNCAARSVTDEIPICGMAATAPLDSANSNTQTSTTSGVGSITITGSMLITLVATLFRL